MRRSITPLQTEAPIEPPKKVKFIHEAMVEGEGRIIEPTPIEYLVPKQAIKVYERLPYYVGNTLVIGSTGSGKSVAIANILLHVKNIPHVYLFVKTMDFDDDESYRSILYKRKIPYSIHDIAELPAIISSVEERAKEENKDKPLMIFDDIGADLSKSTEFLDFIKHARKVTKGVIVSIQSHEQIPPGVYKNMKRFILFSNLPDHEIDIILDKMPSDIDKSHIKKALAIVKKQYNFIVVDLLNRIITEKFNRVIYG